jgi:hypothetical protein
VRTRAHTCSRVGAAFHPISHIAERTSCRSGQLLITCGVCAARVAEPCGEEGRANAARNAGDGLAGEAPRRHCRFAARAAAKPAAATRARGRERVRTGCHTCGHVLTRAHGCAAGSAFQTVPHIATRTSCRSGPLVIKRCTRLARAAELCREAHDSQFVVTQVTAWQAGEAPRWCCSIAAARATVEPSAATRAHWRHRVRTGCHGCVNVPTRAYGCAAGSAWVGSGLVVA